MEKLIKQMVKSSFITSGILAALGLLLFLKSDDTIVAISYLVGGTIIILGVLAFIKFLRSDKNVINSFEIIYGIITVVFGIFIISKPTLIATVIPFIIGGWILIKSSFKLTYAMELRNANNNIWKSALITSIISALVGVLMIFNPFRTSVIVFKLIGMAIFIYAIIDIISTIQLKKSISEFTTSKETSSENQIEKKTTTEYEIVEADIEEIKEENNQEEKPKKKKRTKKEKKDKENQ